MNSGSREGSGDLSPHEAWEDVLTSLERDISEAEAMLEVGHVTAPTPAGPAWTPPVGLGALPEELVERARDLLEGHTDVQKRLEHAIASGRRHSALVSASRARTGAAPAYLDLEA